MQVTINVVENGYVMVVNDEDQSNCFIAFDLEHLTDLLHGVLGDLNERLDLTGLAFDQVKPDVK